MYPKSAPQTCPWYQPKTVWEKHVLKHHRLAKTRCHPPNHEATACVSLSWRSEVSYHSHPSRPEHRRLLVPEWRQYLIALLSPIWPLLLLQRLGWLGCSPAQQDQSSAWTPQWTQNGPEICWSCWEVLVSISRWIPWPYPNAHLWAANYLIFRLWLMILFHGIHHWSRMKIEWYRYWHRYEYEECRMHLETVSSIYFAFASLVWFSGVRLA